MPTQAIRIKGRELKPHRTIVSPLLTTRNVLTNNPCTFVSLWLLREKKKKALFYWHQAREFSDAASGLPIRSSPLLHYYTFMNATKALLEAKSITYLPRHGVTADRSLPNPNRLDIVHEGIEIMPRGILPALSAYLGETEIQTKHNLRDMFFNIPWIHRTYCHTYRSQTDMYVPLKHCSYVVDTDTNLAFLRAEMSEDFPSRRYLSKLPASFTQDPSEGPNWIRSVATVTVTRPNNPTEAELAGLATLNTALRRDLNYVSATQALWYVRAEVSGPPRIQRYPVTLALGAMHRLSELCRYQPIKLSKFLAGKKNWLLTEFIEMAPGQFLDAIASEMTGYQFLAPNVRPAR